MKISKVQRKIILRMREGWELGQEMGFHSSHWLQKKGIGKGGESLDVRVDTVHALFKRKLIQTKSQDYPIRKYELTEKGREIEI